MIDLSPQYLKTDAGELVVLTRAEFDSLLAVVATIDEARTIPPHSMLEWRS